MASQSFTPDDYFKVLNLDSDPFHNSYSEKLFFTTPELQHRLDLIKHLLEFSQQVLLIKGMAKVGKTVFVQHLMSRTAEEWLVCRISATAEIGPDILVKSMLREHMDESEDTSETIAALNRYLIYCNLNARLPVLFVDDADKLNQTTLRFIFRLIEFKEQETFIRVVLIGQDSLSQRLNEIAEELSNIGLVHTISIPAFSLEETAAYLRYRLSACGGREDMFSEKEINRIHKVSAGLAGDINFLARQGLSDPAGLKLELPAPKSIARAGENTQLSGKIIIAGLLSMFIIISLWFYWQEGEPTGTELMSVKLPAKPLLISNKSINELNQKEAEPLPDVWLESQVIVKSSEEAGKQLIEVPIEVKTEAEVSNEDKDAIGVSESRETSLAEIERRPALQTPVATRDKVEPLIANIRGHQWLLAQSADRYVLQLIGAIEITTITHFLKDTQLDRKHLSLYKTLQSNKDWYVLVYGLYSDRETARAAINTLSTKVRDEKPWPKTMVAIHEAITSQ